MGSQATRCPSAALTEEQIATLAAWADAGAPEGEPVALPAAPARPALDAPTVVLDPGTAYAPPTDRDDDYRCFIVDPQVTSDAFLTAYEVHPDAIEQVHHVVLYTIDSDAEVSTAHARDAAEPGPGYTCFGGAETGGGRSIAVWAPGTGATYYPDGTGIRLYGGRELVMQVHYNRATREDRTTVALELTADVEAEGVMTGVFDVSLELAPGMAVTLHGVYPHILRRADRARTTRRRLLPHRVRLRHARRDRPHPLGRGHRRRDVHRRLLRHLPHVLTDEAADGMPRAFRSLRRLVRRRDVGLAAARRHTVPFLAWAHRTSHRDGRGSDPKTPRPADHATQLTSAEVRGLGVAHQARFLCVSATRWRWGGCSWNFESAWGRGYARRVPRLLLIASGVLFAQACTVIVAGDDAQCSVDEDCVARGFDTGACVEQVCVETEVEDPVWGCLGKVVEPEPDPTKSVEFEIRLAYAVGGAAVSTDTVVDICDKLDITCADLDPKYPKGLSPDSDGIVDVVVPEGFDGFVQVIGPNLVDSRVYVGRPLVEPPSVEEIQLLSPTDFELLATLAGDEPDPTRGSAIVLVLDCSGEGVAGVRFETPNADSETQQFYLINQAPTLPPTATATDKDGFGGFFNLPLSAAVVRAFRDEDDVFIGESSFQVLEQTISYVLVAPTPQ